MLNMMNICMYIYWILYGPKIIICKLEKQYLGAQYRKLESSEFEEE